MFGGHRKIEKQRKSRGALADPGPCDLLEILELYSGVGERWILFPKLRQAAVLLRSTTQSNVIELTEHVVVLPGMLYGLDVLRVRLTHS